MVLELAHLESGTGSVVDVGQDLDGFLEHDAKGGVGAVTLKAGIVGARDFPVVLDYLQ